MALVQAGAGLVNAERGARFPRVQRRAGEAKAGLDGGSGDLGHRRWGRRRLGEAALAGLGDELPATGRDAGEADEALALRLPRAENERARQGTRRPMA